MKVLLIVPNFHQAIGILGVNIIKACPLIEFFVFKSHDLLRRKSDFLKLAQNVDAVHWLSNVSRLPFDFDDLLGEVPCPTVGTVHHVSPGEEDKIRTASLCDVVHVVSAEWMEEVSKTTREPVILAHHPVDLSRYLSLNQELKTTKPYRVGAFGFADSLTGRKRIDILLESLGILKSRNVPVELVVQGPRWDQLIPAFTQAGIRVRNLGYASAENAWKAYGEIDLYVCSSDVEGGPMTVIEALASRIPVVSTRVGVAPELLKDGGGILVEKNNPSQLAAAMETLLTNNEVYQQHRLFTEKSIAIFSQENISKEYQNLYTNAIQSWEGKKQTPWKRISKTKINPSTQRKVELIYSKLALTPFFQAHPGKPRQIIEKVLSILYYS